MKRKPNFWLRALVIFVICALIIAIMVLNYETNGNIKKLEQLEEENLNEQMKRDELQNRYDSEIDDEYIEQVAREKGFNKKGEVIYYNNLPQS